MTDTVRALRLCCCATLLLAQASLLHAQDEPPAPLLLLDVPFLSQSEALCGGAAAAMVMRYWGERGVSAESFAHLIADGAAGIRTADLVDDLRRRGWTATGIEGRAELARRELAHARPVLALIEDRPSTYHYVVLVAWSERGVVFHDPARAPFRVMSSTEFERRWRAADRWMAVVVPSAPAVAPTAAPPESISPANDCETRIAEGVHHAQAGDLEEAERTLVAALACPGGAAARELAGVRLLQRRWTEVAYLATAAVVEDEQDHHAWKLLATSRFVEGDRLGALEAWNRAGEPRLDLVSVDGLVRTRHRVIERLLDMPQGRMVTPDGYTRAARRLRELPSAASTRLDYVPVPSGLAELRAVVADRPLVPSGRLTMAVLGVRAAAGREVQVTVGSMTGGGEAVSLGWRFWRDRPRVSVALDAPAAWGGVWGVELFGERQPFSSSVFPATEKTGARLRLSDWATPRVRWEASGGLERREVEGAVATLGGAVRFVSPGERIALRAAVDGWIGRVRFGTAGVSLDARSASEPRRYALLASVGALTASEAAAPDLWPAGDVGHARPMLLRAHPLLDGAGIRPDRLGRTLVHGSFEVRRWWRTAGVLRVGPAVFLDVGRTARRLNASGLWDADAGAGARLAADGLPGVLRIDLARGLRDGATALSFVYVP